MNIDNPALVIYKKLILEGKPANEAAKIAQARTGISVVTGRPINRQLPSKVEYNGQYK